FPFSIPTRRQHIQGITPGLGFFGYPPLQWHAVGTSSTRCWPQRELLEVTPFPVPIGCIGRAVLSTGFLDGAHRSVYKAAGVVSIAILAPACQPLTLVASDDGSSTPSLSLPRDTC